MSQMEAPTLAQLTKVKARLAEAESPTGEVSVVNQIGINMVDLMMWLVIAALLLAAALQGIGFYQTAAWTYQAKSDVASVRTYMEAQYTLNANVYPAAGTLVDGRATPATDTTGGALDLTGKNKAAVLTSSAGAGWTAKVESDALQGAGKPYTFSFGSTTDNNIKATGASTDTW